ncbi:MAG: hypothetical protein METHP_01168 [Methanoregula sp. SKADARSKE-2]|nr:MAG: hypothetical protein METHP_01168 [Methanoregula sp. SKADARSKE-2]
MSYLDKITAKDPSANPFFSLMGIEVVSLEPGKAILKMQVRPAMLNGAGWLQGGMLVALADEAVALATYPGLDETEGSATISESTSFIRGAREGVISAEGRLLKKGRRVAFEEAEVFTGSDERIILSRTSAAFAVTAMK